MSRFIQVVIAKFVAKLGKSIVTQDVSAGTGRSVQLNDQCEITYAAWRLDQNDTNPVLDKQVYAFRLGASATLKGLDQGLVGMSVGGRRLVCLPGQMGFGHVAIDGIPAYSDILLQVRVWVAG
jgi:FKBP-type peptidyl-prolyl cis-trans isomerase